MNRIQGGQCTSYCKGLWMTVSTISEIIYGYSPNLLKLQNKNITAQLWHTCIGESLCPIQSKAILCYTLVRKTFQFQTLNFRGNCWIQYTAIHMMIDLQQVQNGISRINVVDVRLIHRPACVLYSAVAPNVLMFLYVVFLYHSLKVYWLHWMLQKQKGWAKNGRSKVSLHSNTSSKCLCIVPRCDIL